MKDIQREEDRDVDSIKLDLLSLCIMYLIPLMGS